MSRVFIAYGNNQFSIVREVVNDDGVVTYKTLETDIKSEFEAEVKLKKYMAERD